MILSFTAKMKIVNYKSSSDDDSDAETRPTKKRIVVEDVHDVEYKRNIRGEASQDLLRALPKPLAPSSSSKKRIDFEPIKSKQTNTIEEEIISDQELDNVQLFTIRNNHF